jgi:hypothetical protein
MNGDICFHEIYGNQEHPGLEEVHTEKYLFRSGPRTFLVLPSTFPVLELSSRLS